MMCACGPDARPMPLQGGGQALRWCRLGRWKREASTVWVKQEGQGAGVLGRGEALEAGRGGG